MQNNIIRIPRVRINNRLVLAQRSPPDYQGSYRSIPNRDLIQYYEISPEENERRRLINSGVQIRRDEDDIQRERRYNNLELLLLEGTEEQPRYTDISTVILNNERRLNRTLIRKYNDNDIMRVNTTYFTNYTHHGQDDFILNWMGNANQPGVDMVFRTNMVNNFPNNRKRMIFSGYIIFLYMPNEEINERYNNIADYDVNNENLYFTRFSHAFEIGDMTQFDFYQYMLPFLAFKSAIKHEYSLSSKVLELEVRFEEAINIEVENVPIQGVNYMYSDNRISNNESEYNCVINAFILEMQKKNIKKIPSVEKIMERFEKMDVCIDNGISYNQLIKYCDEYNVPCKITMISPLEYNGKFSILNKYVNSNYDVDSKKSFVLSFIINENHMYPIKDNDLKRSISEGEKLILDDKSNFDQLAGNSYDIYVDENTEYESDVILVKTHLSPIIQALQRKYNTKITHTRLKRGNVKIFKHPVNGKIYVHCEDYDNIKKLCEKLGIQFNLERLSIASVIKYFVELKCGKIPHNFYNNETKNIIDQYFPRAFIQSLDDMYLDPENAKNIDLNSSYPNAIINNQDNIPIFTGFDYFRKYKNFVYKNSFFLVKKNVIISQLNNLVIPSGLYYTSLIKKWIEKKYISHDDISHYVKPMTYLKSDVLSNVYKFIAEKIDDKKLRKKTLNTFSGCFGSRYIYKTQYGILNDKILAHSLINAKYQDEDISLCQLNDEFIVKKTNKIRMTKDHFSIYMFIISRGIEQVFDLIDKMKTEESVLFAVSTDSITISHPNDIDETCKEEILHLPKYTNKLRQYDIKLKLGKKKQSLNVITEYENKSFMADAKAGFGKSYFCAHKLVNYYKERALVLSFTNKNVCNLKQYGIDNVKTLDSEFFSDTIHNMKEDVIIVDEFYQAKFSFFQLLYLLKNQGKIIIFLGDRFQTPAVQKISINYYYERFVREIIDNNIFVLERVKNCNRFTDEYWESINFLLNTGRFDDKLKARIKIPTDAEFFEENTKHITRINITRDEVHTKICDNEIRIGSPVFFNKNLKKYNMFNAMEYIVQDLPIIDNKPHVKINDRIFPLNDNYVRLSYGATIYKFQGSTLPKIIIHNIDEMNLNEIYTSISRCHDFEDLIMIPHTKEFFEENEYKRFMEYSNLTLVSKRTKKEEKEQITKSNICSYPDKIVHEADIKIYRNEKMYFINFRHPETNKRISYQITRNEKSEDKIAKKKKFILDKFGYSRCIEMF